MKFTLDFSKALKSIFLVFLLLLIPKIWVAVNNYNNIGLGNIPTFSQILPKQILNLLTSVVLWSAIFYVSKDRLASVVGFIITVIGQALFIHYYLDLKVGEEMGENLYWRHLLFSFLSFAIFGLIHFKKSKGLLLGFIAIILSGINYSGYFTQYNDLLKIIFELVHLEEYLSIDFPTEKENSFKVIYPLNELVSVLRDVIPFIIFWVFYSYLKKESTFDKSFRTIIFSETPDKKGFAIAHWALRMILVISFFGALRLWVNFYRNEFSLVTLSILINSCLAIYVVASLYRNILLAYYIPRKSYPSWFYVFLNIPIIHFIPWLYLYFMPEKKEIIQGETILDEEETLPLRIANAKASQEQFVKDEKNSAIKVFVIVFIFIAGIFQLMGSDNPYLNTLAYSQMQIVLFLLISILFTIVYMNNSRMVYVLFIFQSLLIIGMLFLKDQELVGLTTLFSLMYLMINYPLYHFDKMKVE